MSKHQHRVERGERDLERASRNSNDVVVDEERESLLADAPLVAATDDAGAAAESVNVGNHDDGAATSVIFVSLVRDAKLYKSVLAFGDSFKVSATKDNRARLCWACARQSRRADARAASTEDEAAAIARRPKRSGRRATQAEGRTA